MTTRRVQELTQRISAKDKLHRVQMAAEQEKRDEQRALYEARLRDKDSIIKQHVREGRERITTERRQNHAMRANLVQVSRPTQDYYDTIMIHVIIF